MQVEWGVFKNFITSRNLSPQWVDDGQSYFIKAFDSYFFLECVLNKKNNNEHLFDFEQNFKHLGNKKLAMSVVGVSKPPFGSKVLDDGSRLFRRVRSTSQEITTAEPTNIDFVVPFVKCKITGLQVLNACLGDTASFYVVDSDSGILSGVPNLVLNCFAQDVFVVPNLAEYPSKYDADLVGGLILRVVYSATTPRPRTIYINLDLHEVVS